MRKLVSSTTTILLLLGGSAEARVDVRAEGLYPEFRSSVSDYTLPAATCTSRFDLTVAKPARHKARIGASRWFERKRTRRLKLEPGQAVRVSLKRAGAREHFWVRCLPEDFPSYQYTRDSRPRSDLYVMTPAFEDTAPNYIAIFDREGVPIWWYKDDHLSIDAKVLDDGTITWGRTPLEIDDRPYRFRDGYPIVRPDGSRVRTVRTVGVETDAHDLELTDDGNYLVMAYVDREGMVDASALNGDAEAHVTDAYVQKVSPTGELLWEWRSQGHVSLEETGRWWASSQLSDEPYDIAHINAVEETESGDYMISLRHTDAIYKVDGETGEVIWKLGGTPTQQSLRVFDDPHAEMPLGGQHDVRELHDGSITIHDNGTNLGRAPRAVRYEISDGTATLVDSQEDPEVTASVCCGSSRLANHAWVSSYAQTGVVSEFWRGLRTFAYAFDPWWTYRAVPVNGEVDEDTLRRGMNARYPSL